ncbi:Tcoingi protein, partial [Trypanosoma conorhini]
TYSKDVKLTCGVPQGSVLGPLLFIIAIDSLSVRLNAIPNLAHGFFADDLTLICRHSDRAYIQYVLQEGLDCTSKWSEENFMEVSVEKTQYTFFGVRYANSLVLTVQGKQLRETRTPKLLGYILQPHKGAGKHVREKMDSGNRKLLQLRAIASPEWGPSKETLRAFYMALIRARVCYGIAVWWFLASPSSRDALERLQARAAHVIAGVPGNANRHDILKEARLCTIDAYATYKALEFYLQAKVRGGIHAATAERLVPSDHTVRAALKKVEGTYETVDDFHKRHYASTLRLAARPFFNVTPPGGLKADAPEAEKYKHTMVRVNRFRNADYQLWTDGSVKLDNSSGAGAILYNKTGHSVRRVSGAGILACSYRAECVAMERGLRNTL